MVLKIVVLESISFVSPPETSIPEYPVFALSVSKSEWKWSLCRSWPELSLLSHKLRALNGPKVRVPPLPPLNDAQSRDVNLQDYLNELVKYKPTRELLKKFVKADESQLEWTGPGDLVEMSGSIELAIGQLPAPVTAVEVVELLAASDESAMTAPSAAVEAAPTAGSSSSGIEESIEFVRFYCVLCQQKLFYFSQRPAIGSRGKCDGSVGLENAAVSTVHGRRVTIEVQSESKRFVLQFKQTETAREWQRALARSVLQMPREHRLALAQLRSILGDYYDDYTDRDLLRFLRDKKFDVQLVAPLIVADKRWRIQLNVRNMTVLSVYDQLKLGKVIFMNIYDMGGHPVIIFKSRLHDPKTDFLQSLQLFLYVTERALEGSKQSGAEEFVLVEDLSGSSKDNVDPRMVKFLLELSMEHFPQRLHKYFAVNAPWYWRAVFALVKPWLTGELLSKVNIIGDVAGLQQFIDVDNLPVELGGRLDFRIDDYIAERARIEKVDLADVHTQRAVHQMDPDLLMTYSDLPTATALEGSRKAGWLKKRGGFVQRFNDRYCVLKGKTLFYFLGEQDTKAEGFVPLYAARVTEERQNPLLFHIITEMQKDCVFSAATPEDKREWLKVLKEEIERINQLYGEAAKCTSGLRENRKSWSHFRSASGSGSEVMVATRATGDESESSADEPNADKSAAGGSHRRSRSAVQETEAGHGDSEDLEQFGVTWNVHVDKTLAGDELERVRGRIAQLEELMWQLRQEGLSPTDRRYFFRVYKRCIVGKELIDALMSSTHRSREEAMAVAQDLVRYHIIHTQDHVSESFREVQYYQLQQDCASRVLNLRKIWTIPARSPPQLIVRRLYTKLNELLSDFVDETRIDLKRVRQTKEWYQFQLATAELQQIDLNAIGPTANDRKAFFINVYNLLLVHAKISLIQQAGSELHAWIEQNAVRYQIGLLRFSLALILHGLLRGNAPSPDVFGGLQPLDKNYPHAKYLVGESDPRIHFALKSDAFYPFEMTVDFDDVNGSLGRCTEKFIRDYVVIYENKKKVKLPLLLKLYRNDFSKPDNLLVSLIELLPESASDLKAKLEASADFSLKFSSVPLQLQLFY